MNTQRQLKDVNSIRQAMWLGNFMRVFPLLMVPGLLIDGLKGLLIAAMVSVLASICGEVLSDRLGGISVNTLYGFGRRSATPREQLAGDLAQARYQKMNQNYDGAMAKLEKILAQDPNNPEAMFVKAQVLWEGYEDRISAKEYLMRVLKVEPDRNAVYHRWALNLYREINTRTSLK